MRSCRSVDTSVQFVECNVDEKQVDSSRTLDTGVVGTVVNTVNGVFTQ